MTKDQAIRLCGGSIRAAAAEIGVSYQAIDKWPDVLPKRIEDRVLAVLARKHLPRSLWRPDAEEVSSGHAESLGADGAAVHQHAQEVC